MNLLLTSDVHFTDHILDSYRWDLFPFLKEQIIKYEINTILILGDLTVDKKNHSASLVNRIVDELSSLADAIPIYILRGNHDFFADENQPFFEFLDKIHNLHFIVEPTTLELGGMKYLLLPNTPNPESTWTDLIPTFTNYNALFIHQTIGGGKAENGTELNGLSNTIFNGVTVWSGDLHCPQSIGATTYVGSPYHINFGSNFSPRILILKDGVQPISIPTTFPRKHTIRVSNPDQLDIVELPETDQIKLVILLTDVLEWEQTRKAIITKCKAKKLNIVKTVYEKADSASIKQHLEQQSKLKTLTTKDLFGSYCDYAKVKPELKQYGELLLEDS